MWHGWRGSCFSVDSCGAQLRRSQRGSADVNFLQWNNRSLLLAAAAVLLGLAAPCVNAQSDTIAGKYQCAQVKVHGKVKPCSSAQLTLKNDGRFELRGWEGEYVVSGEYIELKDKLVRSKAHVEPGFKLVFTYRGKDGLVEVTYERRLSAPGGESLS